MCIFHQLRKLLIGWLKLLVASPVIKIIPLNFKVKEQAETGGLLFWSENLEIYNAPLTMSELLYAMSKTKNTSPGPYILK